MNFFRVGSQIMACGGGGITMTEDEETIDSSKITLAMADGANGGRQEETVEDERTWR